MFRSLVHLPVSSNNSRGQIISSTEYALGRSEHAWRGLREEPDVNVTSVQSTYSSTIPVPVSDERFDCFIPHSIIVMVKGSIIISVLRGVVPYLLSFLERDSLEASVVDSLLILSSNHFIPFSRQIYTTRNNQEPCSTTCIHRTNPGPPLPYNHHDWPDPNPKLANSTTAFLHIRPEDQK